MIELLKIDNLIPIIICVSCIIMFGMIIIASFYDSKNCKGTIQQSTDFAHFSCNNGESSVKEMNDKTYYICTCKEKK